MEHGTAGGREPNLTPVERWALFTAARASSPWWSLVPLAFAVIFALEAVLRGGALVGWPLSAAFVLLALLTWERSGFARLLARQQARIDDLSSREPSA